MTTAPLPTTARPRMSAAPPTSAAPTTSAAQAPSGRVSLLLVVVTLAAAVLAPDAVRAAAPVLLGAGVLVGVPHGALDSLLEPWARGRRPQPGPLLRGASRYGLLVLAALAALVLAPVPVGLGLLGLSALHFGAAEVTYAEERAGVRDTGAWRALAVVVTGALPLLALLTRWHTDADRVLEQVAPGAAAAAPLGLRVALLLGLVGAAAVLAVRWLRAGRAVDVVELAAVTALFALAPPFAAFGVWFGAWHALRHLERVLAVAPGRTAARRLGTLVAVAALPTLGAVALLAAVAASRPPVGAVIAVLLALTVPHSAAVLGFDRAVRDSAR